MPDDSGADAARDEAEENPGAADEGDRDTATGNPGAAGEQDSDDRS